jgi:hypothetical protein
MNVAFSTVCVGNWDLHTIVTGATPCEVMKTVHTLGALDGVLETDTVPVIDIVSISPYLGRLRPQRVG